MGTILLTKILLSTSHYFKFWEVNSEHEKYKVDALVELIFYKERQTINDAGHGFDPWFRKIPWRREWPPTPVFLPGEFH